jgi:hypothetical protein
MIGPLAIALSAAAVAPRIYGADLCSSGLAQGAAVAVGWEMPFDVRQAVSTRDTVSESTRAHLARPSADALSGVRLEISEPRAQIPHAGLMRRFCTPCAVDRDGRRRL